MTSVIHSMVHVPESLKDFGPLQNYSTFNFESVVGMFQWHRVSFFYWRNDLIFITLGSIVQSVNGPNLVVSELTNNINILQAATAELNNVNFNKPLRLFIHRLFSSKRQALPKVTPTNEGISIRLGAKLELPNTHVVMAHLRTIYSLPFYIHATCWKNKVRFSVYEPNSPTQNCDSSLLLKSSHNDTGCGFIEGILCHSTKEYRLVINKICIISHDSLTLKKKCVINPFIFWGKLTNPPQLIIIPIEHIIVKLAYKKEKDLFHFFQFPNTVEST